MMPRFHWFAQNGGSFGQKMIDPAGDDSFNSTDDWSDQNDDVDEEQ